MWKETDSFLFEIPDSWRTFADGRRLVCQGPSREELILASNRVDGPDRPRRSEFVDHLVVNALSAMENTVAEERLVVIEPARRDSDVTAFPCWTMVAETKDRATLFAQAAIQGPGTVMFATFEAPNTPEALAAFRSFLSSVSPPTR